MTSPVLLFLSLPLVLACLYYGFLAVVAVLKQSASPQSTREPPRRISILVPAHNEGRHIDATLHNLSKELDYPKDRYQVFVVADNCTDNTKDVARARSIACLVRSDEQNLGKGAALAWAIGQLETDSYDVLLVVDADCRLDKNALQVIDHLLQSGHPVVQLNNMADNPDESPVSYAACLANYLENRLYCEPKSRLGWSIFLRGTGMAFEKHTLAQLPWKATSIAEDLEYSLQLIRHGIKICYSMAASARSSVPVDVNSLNVQRRRWSGGGMSIIKSDFLDLLLTGIRRRDIHLLDAAMSLWMQSRAFIVLYSGVLLGASILNWTLVRSPLAHQVLVLNLLIVGSILLYGIIGIIAFGLTPKRLTYLLWLPLPIARWLAVAVASWMAKGQSHQEWARSPRNKG